MSLLDDRALAEALRGLSGWTRADRAITKSWRFRDFKEAMFFVNGVAALAERAGHHPDIDVRYSQVTLTLWTHDAGGVTDKDVALARAVEAV
jgi:4a-hydroxytetrahydrobiopterin dehydratase